MTSLGDEAQLQQIAERIGKASASIAIREFVQTHPHFDVQPPVPQKAEIPTPLKWAGGIVAALMTAAVVAMSLWVVSTLNELQLTVTRIDERQQQDTTGKQVDELKARVAALESYHRERNVR